MLYFYEILLLLPLLRMYQKRLIEIHQATTIIPAGLAHLVFLFCFVIFSVGACKQVKENNTLIMESRDYFAPSRCV